MKMLGVGAVVGPSAGAGVVADPVIKPLVFPVGPDVYDSTIMAIRVAMAEKVSLPGPLKARPLMTANEVDQLMKAAYPDQVRYKDYLVHWGPRKVRIKEI